MTKQSYTTWKIDDSESQPLAIIEDNEDGMGVCEIGKPGSKRAEATVGEWEAARLIAAAPEMADELRRLVANNYGQPSGVTVPALGQARAILAKIDA